MQARMKSFGQQLREASRKMEPFGKQLREASKKPDSVGKTLRDEWRAAKEDFILRRTRMRQREFGELLEY